MGDQQDIYETAIVGGSAAGLSAALVLGRSCRRVVMIDDNTPRNKTVSHAHGFLTRDGISIPELHRIAREQLQPYDVTIRDDQVTGISSKDDGFLLTLKQGGTLMAKTVLLATGMRDDLPPVPGLHEAWGKTAFSCPYCHGWEVRDKNLAVLGDAEHGGSFALMLKQWSKAITLLTNGQDVPPGRRESLQHHGITVDTSEIATLAPQDENGQTIHFKTGEKLFCHGVFLQSSCHPRSELAQGLGCEMDGIRLKMDGKGRTTVPGVYAAGDNCTQHSHLVDAAASGNDAAMTLNHDLCEQSLKDTRKAG